MLADLHIHSQYSDSKRTPEEVVRLAKSMGLGLISVCDHDVIGAYKELPALCKAHNIYLIVGTEIQALYSGSEYHILAYSFDLQSKEMAGLLEHSSNILTERNDLLIQKISEVNEGISFEEYKNYKRDPNNGGWESIDYLLHKGFIHSLDDYLSCCAAYPFVATGKSKSVKEVIDVIHRAGGKAVLAHGGKTIDNDPKVFDSVLLKMLEFKIDGFECYYTAHSPEITQKLLDFAKSNKLIITAGSDDHGGFNNRPSEPRYLMGSLNTDTELLNLNGLEII